MLFNYVIYTSLDYMKSEGEEEDRAFHILQKVKFSLSRRSIRTEEVQLHSFS